MFRGSCVITFILFACSPLLANEPHQRQLSQMEIHHDLFSNARYSGVISDLHLQMQELGRKRKSPTLAVLYSLLLPGLGEYYAENYSSGRFFSIAEGALWLTYFTFDVYGTSLRNDARSFAISHAGINPSGKTDQFYVDIGNFLSTEEFNDKRLRDREPERLYDVNEGFGWRWDSDASRAQFKETRLSGETALNNRKFVVAAIILNHVVSAINAARGAISQNKSVNDQIGALQLKADVMGGAHSPHGIMLTVSRNF